MDALLKMLLIQELKGGKQTSVPIFLDGYATNHKKYTWSENPKTTK